MADRIEQAGKREGCPTRAQQARVAWLLIAILGIALGPRIWGIAYGLAYYKFRMDEIYEVVRALKAPASTKGFGKGGLYFPTSPVRKLVTYFVRVPFGSGQK